VGEGGGERQGKEVSRIDCCRVILGDRERGARRETAQDRVGCWWVDGKWGRMPPHRLWTLLNV
jgi:hypothetical protein